MNRANTVEIAEKPAAQDGADDAEFFGKGGARRGESQFDVITFQCKCDPGPKN